MLYLVSPEGLYWTGSVGQEAIDYARAAEKDLGLIEGWWEPTAEVELNAGFVRSALRWGLASERGIVVVGWRTVVQQRPRELELLIAESVPRMKEYRESPEVRAIDRLLELDAPGWTAHGEKLDADVEASMKETLAEAVAEAREELRSVQVDPELRSLWVRLGGVLPDPE